MSGRSRPARRPSRANKYQQQYLSFLRKWKSYVHSQQYAECERLCLDHIDRIDRSIRSQIKQYAQRHGGAVLDYNDSRFYDIKNYRSKVRNLYAVLLHDHLKQHNDALEQYELCVEDDEFNASAHYNWAILYKNYYKDFAEAEKHYRKAIELKPNHAAYHNNYGLLLEQQLKKYDAAKKQFGIALSLDDKNGRAHTNMANLLKKHYQDYQTARVHYEKAIQLDPQNPTRHFNYALFLKHNLRDYSTAANEYERAIALDNNYYQAHNEYKNFLLTESPFHRARRNNQHTTPNGSGSGNGSANDAPHTAPGTAMDEMAERREHCHRCIKYALNLFANKKAKDAREVLTMALKCQPQHVLANLLQDPYHAERQPLYQSVLQYAANPAMVAKQGQGGGEDMVAHQQLQEYQQIVSQRDSEIYALQSRMQQFHGRLSTITSKLKRASTTASTRNVLHGLGADMAVADGQSASESNWNLTQLDSLREEMGEEIQRLNSHQQSPQPQQSYPLSDDDEDEGGAAPNYPQKLTPRNGAGGGGGGVRRDQLMALPPAHANSPFYNGPRSQTASKRNSLISVNSASDFNHKYIDIHKQTLFSAAKILENMLSNAQPENNYNGMHGTLEARKKLEDVMQMILATVRVWDFMEFDNAMDGPGGAGGGGGGVHGGPGGHGHGGGGVGHNLRLTENNVLNHNEYDRDDENAASLLSPDDDVYDATKTLGGMSMVSATSSAAMEQRKHFLRKAANNPNVRKQERIVAKYLAQTFLSTRADTPKSVLSQSQLPFFSDEEEEDDADDDLDAATPQTKQNAVQPAPKHAIPASNVDGHVHERRGSLSSEKENRITAAETRCEQRVLRWKQNAKLQEYLAHINEWDFDIFYVVENAGNYAMPAIFLTLADHRGLLQQLNLNVTHLCNYFHQISLEYKNNPYHNMFHGCDVLVNCNYFLNAKLMRNIRTLDQFACLVAAAAHDVAHPGNNNGFEIERESDLAITYSDKSVLEAMHIAVAWQVMKRPGCNILSSLDKKQRKEFRKLFIACILNTDMSHHAEQQKLLADLIDAVTNSGIDLEQTQNDEQMLDDDDDVVNGGGANGDAQQQQQVSRRSSLVSISNISPNSIYADPAKFATVVIPLLVHTADLSNPSKDIKLYYQWAKRVVDEFFNQAESEKKLGLPVSAFMDREQTDLPTIQVGFVNHVIRPWFDLWARLLTDKKQGPLYTHNVGDNLKFFQTELEKSRKTKADQQAAEAAASHNKNGVSPSPNQERSVSMLESMGGKAPAPMLTEMSRSVSMLESIGEPTDSVVDATFEDIMRLEMKIKMQKFEELKSRQREYYATDYQQLQQRRQSQEQQGGAIFVTTSLNHHDSEYRQDYDEDADNDDDGDFNQQHLQPANARNSAKKKKMLYTGADYQNDPNDPNAPNHNSNNNDTNHYQHDGNAKGNNNPHINNNNPQQQQQQQRRKQKKSKKPRNIKPKGSRDLGTIPELNNNASNSELI